MYGTVARIRVKAENREKLREVLERQSYETVPGFKTSYILWQDDTDAAWLIAIFEDRAAYERKPAVPPNLGRTSNSGALPEDGRSGTAEGAKRSEGRAHWARR